MDRQPDKLFREKLRGLQKPVPESAWKRISENLHHEERRYPWLRMAAAAAVLLILLTAVLLIVPRQDDSRNTLADRRADPKTQPGPSHVEERGNPQEAQPTVRDEKNASEASQHEVTRQPVKKGNGDPQSHRPDVQAKEKSPGPRALNPDSLRDNTFFAHNESLPDRNGPEPPATRNEGTAVPAPVAAKQSPQRVKIVFSAEEVDEKYLDKNELAEATREGKNSSSIRKLLDKAYDLKFNQDPIGQLRQKKNEILALNFRNEKVHHD